MKPKKYDYFIGSVAILALILLLAELSSFFNAFLPFIKTLNLCCLLIFISDVLFRFAFFKDKLEYLRRNWFDFIILIPLVQFIRGFDHTPFFVISWQIVIISTLVSRLRKLNKFIELLSLKPAHLMVGSFAAAIIAGAVLLMLPASSQAGARTTFVDAFFTATSATCVTGLAVVDTGSHFSLFGQTVILFLIQIGGLGIMTFSVSVAMLLKKQVGAQKEIAMQDILDQDTLGSVKNLVLFLVKMTVALELMGALFLFASWIGQFHSIPKTAYYALFHSVSAFCNAGFSPFSDSLMSMRSDISTNVIICFLIISGGIGFTVIRDVTDNFRNKFVLRHEKLMRFKMQTKVVFAITALLILLGGCAFYFLEAQGSFAGFDTKGKIIASLFQSVSTRTAGFNTVDIGRLSASTLLIAMFLMFIGAAPGSTAGGVKVTTLAVLWATLVASFRQKEQVEIYKRTIPAEVIKKAITLFIFSAGIVFVFAAILVYTEHKEFLAVLFETVSAFGTVGLSTGITPSLTGKGKLIISLLMFIGRIGPLALAYAIIRYRRPAKYEYAEERVMIG
ncbi:MAG: TrkH family potassium uptake protein [Candidatus Omnitrophota bacterium]